MTGAQAWLAAGVYELVAFIQARFKAVLPEKYLVRMDRIARRRQLKERRRAPKVIEVNGEMISWNNPVKEAQQGHEEAKGDGKVEETTNLSKSEENKGTAAGAQARKRKKSPENAEEEDSQQDEKTIRRKTKEEEVEHGEEETAWKQVQKAKGKRRDQGKIESRLQPLRGPGREDESSEEDGKEFKGKGNREKEEQKEPVGKAEDAKDVKNKKQDKQAVTRTEKAAKKESKEKAKQEARACFS